MMSEIYRNIKLPCNWTLCQYWPGEIILKHPSRQRGIYIKAPWYRHQDKVRWEAENGSFALEDTVNPKNEHGFRPLNIRDWAGAKVYSCRFAYVTRYGHTQVADMKAYRTRTRQVRWWLRWMPFAGHDLDSLIAEFSDEMGSERGSWKGGVIGTSCSMRPGETPMDAINRFLNEAQETHGWDR